MSCILTRPTRSPKYGETRNNIPRYYTLNRPRKFIYFHTASQSFRILSANCPFRHILRLLVLFSSFLYVCFSSLFAAGDVSREGTSANQLQKFHTDDVNHWLINKSGSHGVPNPNLKCCVHLRRSSSITQMLVLEKTIFHKYWLFC